MQGLLRTSCIIEKRGGEDLRRMQPISLPIKFSREMNKEYIAYGKVDVDKATKGGLKELKRKGFEESRIFAVHLGQPDIKSFCHDRKCFVCTVRKYQMHCPKDHWKIGKTAKANAGLFLRPKAKWKPNERVWYKEVVLGKNTLAKTTEELISQVKEEDKKMFIGKYSNHSWKHTGINRLFHAGLTERQVVNMYSHHNSIEAVQAYRKQENSDRQQVHVN